MQEKHCPIYVERISDRDTAAACYTASNFKEKQIQNDFNENPTQSEQGSFFLLSAVKIHKIWLQKNFLKKFNFFAYNFENFWLSIMRA